MAGYFQNKYPNPCRFSPNNYFGSKFVTVCVTGKLFTLCHNQIILHQSIKYEEYKEKTIYLTKLHILIIGDEKNQIHMEGYQVSNQCMALVRDGCLVPTKDAPELGYVIESTDKQYVPDVFYKVSTYSLFDLF